jgi:lycopene cyclase domain-containing protein
MESSSYLVVMALCLVVTLPLEWAFDARVYRRPRRTARALVPVIVVFYLWDVLAIARGHWDFADVYVTGVVLPLGVPLEELVFFIVIPLCALLSYESVRNLLGRRVGWFESLRSRPPATSSDGSGV